MPRIHNLAFWTGGVLTPHVAQVVQDVLWPDAAPGPDVRFQLRNMDNELCIGALDAEIYCQRAITLAGADMPPGELASRVERGLVPTPGILAVLDELAGKVTLRLLSNYPRRWLDPVLSHTGLGVRFPDALVSVAPEHGFDRSFGALFDMLITSGAFVPGTSLLVDDNPLRGMAAIRAGLDFAIFVDAPRFRRDLFLWGLLPPVS